MSLRIAAVDDDFSILLQTDGTIIFFNTRTPTAHELATSPHIVMSSAAPWNPRNVHFPAHHDEEGESMTHHEIACCNTSFADNTFDLSTLDFERTSVSLVLADRLVSQVNVNGKDDQDVSLPRTFTSKERHVGVSAQELSERWFIGLSQAHDTIKATTQNCTRSALLPLSRRYRVDCVFERPLFRGDFYTDTMDGRSKSIDGNCYAQIIANKDFFAFAYPMTNKSSAGESLRRFIHEYGRPEKLTFDGSQEQCGCKTEFMANVRKYAINYHITEPYRPNHNFAEGVIREIRKKWFRVMVRKSVPQRLWDFGLQWVCDIQNCTANSARGLDGQCPLERITGETVDISECHDFGFYDWVWYRENAGLGETRLVGRWLGVSHRIGTLMSFWIITSNGKVLSRTTVQRVTNLELQVEENKHKCAEFTSLLAARVGDPDHIARDGDGDLVIPNDWNDPEFTEQFIEEFGRPINDPSLREADHEFTPDTYDNTYLNMELALPWEGAEVQFGRVVKRLRDKDGIPIGTAHDNPIFDTLMYEVKFQDGHRAMLAANVIDENLFAEIDDEDNRHVLYEESVNHQTNGKQILQQDAFIVNRSGTRRRRETTVGWEVLVRWKDGSTTWVTMGYHEGRQRIVSRTASGVCGTSAYC